MRAYVLLDILNELRKCEKCKAGQAIYRFFATSLKKAIIQEHECQIIFIIWH